MRIIRLHLNSSRDATSLPQWIPPLAAEVYANGNSYSDQRLEQATEILFYSKKLQQFWEHVAKKHLDSNSWPVLIGTIILAVGHVPPEGYGRASDRAHLKMRIRGYQKGADKLLSRAADQTYALAETLSKLRGFRASLPVEAESLLALIERTLSVPWNPSADDFDEFRNRLSSAQEASFPVLEALLCTLARQLNDWPQTPDILADNPWLSSQKSTWVDIARMINHGFAEMDRVYSVKILLREMHWVSLVQTLIHPHLARTTIQAGLSRAGIECIKLA